MKQLNRMNSSFHGDITSSNALCVCCVCVGHVYGVCVFFMCGVLCVYGVWCVWYVVFYVCVCGGCVCVLYVWCAMYYMWYVYVCLYVCVWYVVCVYVCVCVCVLYVYVYACVLYVYVQYTVVCGSTLSSGSISSYQSSVHYIIATPCVGMEELPILESCQLVSVHEKLLCREECNLFNNY